MGKLICSLGLFGVLACSGGAGSISSAGAAPASPAVPARGLVPVASDQAQAAPLEYRNEAAESDRVFVENAERAIGQYTEFLARSGTSEEYAAAVERSREQIEDLRVAIDFVRAGARQRAAH
ncbi:MAG: hypothetical protein WDO69_27320 [Pseudomonadota bacterium]